MPLDAFGLKEYYYYVNHTKVFTPTLKSAITLTPTVIAPESLLVYIEWMSTRLITYSSFSPPFYLNRQFARSHLIYSFTLLQRNIQALNRWTQQVQYLKHILVRAFAICFSLHRRQLVIEHGIALTRLSMPSLSFKRILWCLELDKIYSNEYTIWSWNETKTLKVFFKYIYNLMGIT